METFAQLFSYVCGQVHLCIVNGEALPLCERCVGLYFGGVCAIALAAIRPRATGAMLWVHGLLMLAMFPFGFHLIPHGTVVRIVSGQLFAYGLTYFLLLIPLGDAGTRGGRRATLAYFSALPAGIVLLLVLVWKGGHVTSVLLAATASIGLATYALLVMANLAALGTMTVRTIWVPKRSLNA